MRKIILFTMVLAFLNKGFAQNQNKVIHPWCKVTGSSAEAKVNPVIKIPQSSRYIDPAGVVYVPVVFHILYNNSAENIPDDLLYSQIDRLNMDLRKLNPEVAPYAPWVSLQSDVKVEFRLACINPQGNYTNGITRTFTSVGQFITEDQIKFDATDGQDAWPTDTYLNIWVGDLDDATGYLGDAQFPSQYNLSPPGGNPGFLVDGIILDYKIVGDNNGDPYNSMGRVATHEIGHWLGLEEHTFSGGVCAQIEPDIPPQDSDFNRQCPSFPVLGDFCTPSYPGVMFMNYMNYTDDACRYMFTPSQQVLMRGSYSTTGPGSQRYQFITNYFGIKHYQTSAVCNTFSVKMRNPMCLPVNYSFSGPVTEVYRDNQEIIFQVNTGVPSGTLNLTATTAAPYNYTDDYVFNFTVSGVSPASPTITTSMSSPGVATQLVSDGVSYSCSISNVPGATIQWEVLGAVITAGQGTNTITFVPDAYSYTDCGWQSKTPVTGKGNQMERNPLCHVLIKVRSTIEGCTSNASQIIFNYDLGCGGMVPCCSFQGQTCCAECRSVLSVYPNPADHQVTVEVGKTDKPILKAEIIDGYGNRKRTVIFPVNTRKAVIRTEELWPGEYFIRTFNGEKWEAAKLRVL